MHNLRNASHYTFLYFLKMEKNGSRKQKVTKNGKFLQLLTQLCIEAKQKMLFDYNYFMN